MLAHSDAVYIRDLIRRMDDLEEANEALQRRLNSLQSQINLLRGGGISKPSLQPDDVGPAPNAA